MVVIIYLKHNILLLGRLFKRLFIVYKTGVQSNLFNTNSTITQTLINTLEKPCLNLPKLKLNDLR